MGLKIKMNLNNEDLWEQIIYRLNGTCDSLSHVLYEFEAEQLEDHLPFLDRLDVNIFRCECCHWWCDISEMSEEGDWECRDCVPDNE